MDKEKLKKIIISQQELFDKENFIERENLEKIKKSFKYDFVTILSGIRRCGKSTILDYLRNTNNHKYYINFDDEKLSDFEIKDFEKLEECFLELFDKQNTFYFDEIQNIKGFEKFIRRLHNEKKKVFIAGSNANLLSKELGTHLTGRYIRQEIFPFSFKEYLNYKKIKVQKEDFYKVEKCIKIKKTFEKYLKFGGFPQFFKQKERDFLYFLFENIIYKDVILRYNIKNQTTIKEICKFLISNVSKPISFSKIKDLFNLSSATTVKEYINYLEEVYLFFTINKFDYSYKKQLVNSKKIYSIDTAFSSYLSFKFSEDLGRQLENIVFLYFKRESKYEIFYHKDNFECDFLLKEKDKIVKAVQVTKTS